jgi:hypothetical protein
MEFVARRPVMRHNNCDPTKNKKRMAFRKSSSVALLLSATFALTLHGCAEVPPDADQPVGAAARAMGIETASNAANTDTAETTAEIADAEYPKSVTVNDQTVIIHPPQIRSWSEFAIIEGIAAIETVPKDAGEDARFGVVSFTANAMPDLDTRTVTVSNIKVATITENDEPLPDSARAALEGALPKVRVLPLDLVLSHLAEDAIPESASGIKADPPTIFFSKSSAVLMLLHGEPVLAPLPGLTVKSVPNTNWSLFKHESAGKWYLRNDDTWLEAGDYTGPWGWAGTLPEDLAKLPDDGNWRSTKIAATQWRDAPKFPPPNVFVSTEPAELILLVGEPELTEIGDLGLASVANTESQLFKVEDTWYYLVSGRWFKAVDLAGDWQSADDLPEAFASIPTDHAEADILASVPHTPEARMAAFEAQIPKRTTVPVGTEVPETITYAGEPRFEPIAGTELQRAANTYHDVILAGGRYYLCYSGMWYLSNAADGPWVMATAVPPEIYTIPPNSPAYHTTYVQVYGTTPTTVTYAYSSGYSNMYVSSSVVVYGSGWYYPPYYYYYGGYPYYYAYPYSYGSSSFYNPRTGTYGSVTRAYGPYGGWGYASGYNPRTGTYARAEAAFDHDDWYAAGEAYNPRSGRYYGTERHYDDDNNSWEVDSTLQGRRGDMDISREFDEDSGRAEISTSRGGEGTFTRRASDGGWDTSGQYTTADGRTISSSGRYENGQGSSTLTGSEGGTGTINRSVGPDGVTREGSFSKDGQTFDSTTQRSGTGRGPTTTLEGSQGGQAVVTGRGLDRTAVGKTASGDVYAARDGSVYRRTDDGWQKRSGGDWSGSDTIPFPSRDSAQSRGYGQNRSTTSPERGNYQSRSSTQARANAQNRAGQYRSSASRTGQYSGNRSSSSLNRDYQARQRGMSRSRQFSGGGRGRRR